MKKKAQGLSIEIVALATIAVIIIVIMAYLLTSRTTLFVKSIEDCKEKGGEDLTREQCLERGGIPSFKVDTGDDKICCLFG